MKPIIYVSMDANGGIAAMQVAHPTSPPEDGGVWITYAAASTNLAAALQENKKLEGQCQKLQSLINYYEGQRAMSAQGQSEGMSS